MGSNNLVCPGQGRIVGIDPGINTTGYAVLQLKSGKCLLEDKGFIRPPRNKPFQYRLSFLYEAFVSILKDVRPRVVVVEEIYSHIRYPYTAVLMGHARGVLFLAAEKAHCQIETFSASRIKKAIVGRGNASKEQVRAVLKQIYGLPDEVDSLPLDVTDALALATGYVFCCLRRQGEGNMIK